MKRFRFPRLWRNKKGVAAVEFALILPMFAGIYLGSVELTELLLVNRRVENLAASAADIVARDTLVRESELTDLQEAIDLLMDPNPVSGLKVRVTSIQINSSTDCVVVWSKSYHGYATLANGDKINDLPAELLTGETPSIVRAQVTYDYMTPIRWLLPATFSLKHTEYRRPRLVDPVPYSAT